MAKSLEVLYIFALIIGIIFFGFIGVALALATLLIGLNLSN